VIDSATDISASKRSARAGPSVVETDDGSVLGGVEGSPAIFVSVTEVTVARPRDE
jgi:hypothetical protein